MKKNPKTLAGIIALAVLLILSAILAGQMIPTIQETQRELSLTPTPLPAVPGSMLQVTTDPAAPTPEPILRTGSRGQAVSDLQSRLYTLGYYRDVIDGQFGTGTRDAVIAFQKRNGLESDGRVGPETRETLFSADAKPWAAEETTEAAEN